MNLCKVILALGTTLLAVSGSFALSVGDVVGSYRCYSYNVGGRGGNCRTFTTKFILNGDGSYTFGTSKGTFKIKKDQILFSQEKQRGAATFFDGNKFTFMYTLPSNGWKVEQTYLRIE